MKLSKTCGSLSALLVVVSFNAVNVPLSYAAQLNLQDAAENKPNLTPSSAQSDVCGEVPMISPEALQESPEPLSHAHPSTLVANAVVSDSPAKVVPSQQVAEVILFEDCGIGGVAPEGGLPLAAPGGFPVAAALIPAGAAAAAVPLLATSGNDNNAPNVPEPTETATAGLFACLGIAGVVARRRMKKPTR